VSELSDNITEMPKPAPRCQEHLLLHGRFRADMRVYVEVTRRLESCQQKDFEKTYEAAEMARLAFLRAREELAAHIAAHQCDR
jgi:hypothetical protein